MDFPSIKKLSNKKRYAFLKELQLDQPDAESILVLLAADPSWNVKALAIELLDSFRSSRARTAVKAALNDPKWLVRMTAVETLGSIADPDDAPMLYKMLEDRAWGVRSSAALSLITLSAVKDEVKILLQKKYFQENHAAVRRDIVYALAHTGDDREFFQEALKSEKSEIVCVAFTWVLYDLGEQSRIADFVSFFASQDDLVRGNATQAVDPSAVFAEDRLFLRQALETMIDREDNPGLKEDAAKLLEKIMCEGAAD